MATTGDADAAGFLDRFVAPGRPGVDVFLPALGDAGPSRAGAGVEARTDALDDALVEVLARTTDLGIGAHADDLEFLMLVPIAECLDDPARSFTGVTCTDGAGSARAGAWAACTDEELVVVRREEQRQAAVIGGYGTMVQLGWSSPAVRDPAGRERLVDDLVAVLEATRPQNVYTHNLADKHTTHVAVGRAVVEAIRRLPPARRPHRLVGVEGWRGLDWLPDHEKVLLDATGRDELAAALAACFPSQIDGGKRYDLAEVGRRRANATLREPRDVDDAESITVAMDLGPLIHNEELDPAAYVLGAIDRFRADVAALLRD